MQRLISFEDIIANLAYGKTSIECMQELNSIITAVRENGGKGRLTLTLEVSLSDMNAIFIKDKIKSTRPEGHRDPVTLDVNASGALFLIEENEPLPFSGGNAGSVQVGTIRFNSETGEVLGEDLGEVARAQQ